MLVPDDAGGDEAKIDFVGPTAHAVSVAPPPLPYTHAVQAPAADDPAVAKLAAAGLYPSLAEIPVVAAVEVSDTRAIPDHPWATRRPGSDTQVACADTSLKMSAAILLFFSIVCFGCAVSVATATADLWRGALVVWGACPQILYAALAAGALASHCRCEQRSHAYCAAFACLIPFTMSVFSLSTASAHTRALDRFDACTGDDAWTWALGKEASRKVQFTPQYMHKESSHLFFQGYCTSDFDCADAFPLLPERAEFYEERICMDLNGTAAGREAMAAAGKPGVCAARCAATCNCYKSNADTKGADRATYSACWQFSQWDGKCDDLLDTLKGRADAHATIASFVLVAGLAFINCLFLAACMRPLVGTRVHFVPPPPSFEMRQLPPPRDHPPGRSAEP